MNRLFGIIICALIFPMAAGSVLAEGDTAPPTAVRWDPAFFGVNAKATSGPSPEVITLGMPVVCINGLDVDAIGRMYIQDGGRQVLARYGADGQLDKQWPSEIHDAIFSASRLGIKVLSGERVFLGPGHDGEWSIRKIGPHPEENGVIPTPPGAEFLTASEDGSFYGLKQPADWTADLYVDFQSRLLSFAPDGKPKPNPDAKTVASLGPEALLYQSTFRGKNFIQELDLTGRVVREIDLSRVLPYTFKVQLGHMSADKNGDIYFAHDDFIYRVDSQGNPLARWRVYRTPEQVKYDSRIDHMVVSRGLVYADVGWSESVQLPGGAVTSARSQPNEIQVFTSRGQCVARYVSPVPPLQLPASIAVAPNGSYAVLQREAPNPVAFSADGSVRHEFEPKSPGSSMLMINPKGGFLATHVGVLSQYDANGLNGRVAYDGDSDPRGLDNVWQIASDPANGEIWALGWEGILTHLSSSYQLIKEFPASDALCFRTFSVGMAVDHSGYIYVPNAYGHCIVKINRQGNIVSRIGKEGSGVGELKYPEGIIIDSKDRIYVADSGNCRIQVFAKDGTPLGVWGKPGRGNGEFDRPFSLAFGPNNTLWIADTFNDRIVRLPLKDFWAGIGKKAYFETLVQAPKREPAPVATTSLVYGVVVAGTDDFSDVVCIEDPYRCWAIEARLPKGTKLARGVTAKLWGRIEIKEHEPVRLYADKVEIVTTPKGQFAMPEPHGMDAMYVGDGYRNGDTKIDNSNLGMLVRTWAKARLRGQSGQTLHCERWLVYQRWPGYQGGQHSRRLVRLARGRAERGDAWGKHRVEGFQRQTMVGHTHQGAGRRGSAQGLLVREMIGPDPTVWEEENRVMHPISQIVCLVLILAVSAIPLFAQGNDTPPATAFRWDKEPGWNPPFAATPGPKPPVYNLGGPWPNAVRSMWMSLEDYTSWMGSGRNCCGSPLPANLNVHGWMGRTIRFGRQREAASRCFLVSVCFWALHTRSTTSGYLGLDQMMTSCCRAPRRGAAT